MPLLEINRTERISATITLDVNVASQLDQYAAFLRASADEVVDKALGYVFTKDREFQDFLRSAEASQFRPSLRVRHAARNGGRPRRAGNAAEKVIETPARGK